MPVEQDRGRRVQRRWRTLKGLGWLAAFAAPLALATFALVIWPLPQTPLRSEDFLLYGISRGVTKTFDRWYDKDPAALVIYYRLFLLYVTVGAIAAVGFIARGLRFMLNRGDRRDFAFLLFLQSPALLLFLDDRFVRGGRFGLAIMAALFCIMLPLFWLFSRMLLDGSGAFAAWEARKRRDEAIEGRSETHVVHPHPPSATIGDPDRR